MTKVKSFVFNPFQENTYILYDESKECIILDPGCYDQAEREMMMDFIKANELTPVRLINTHCHIDHVFGNKFIAAFYKLPLEIHASEIPVLDSLQQSAFYFGVAAEPSPPPEKFIGDGDVITFGNTRLETMLTPGHSPGSLTFYCRESAFVISGDVLFYGSIGRTDLPGGNHDTLIRSIKERLMPLEDNVLVYSGHGQQTTIGFERRHNPFL